MQRKVWETVVVVLEKLTVVLEKQAKEDKDKNSQPYALVPVNPLQEQNTNERKPTVSDSGKTYPVK